MFKTELLPHTADLRIRLEADTPEELFQAGASVLNELLKPGFCQRTSTGTIHEAIEVESTDTTALLIDFLSELLTLSYTERAVFCQVNVLHFAANSISARVSGWPAEGFEEDIKAITYHEANVHRNAEGRWETLVVVDI